MAKTIDLIHDFIDESRMMGYRIGGSVFKADYSSKGWTVGFWLRGVYHKDNGGNILWDKGYKHGPRIGKAKDPVFRKAVKKAIARARECEEKYGPEK